MPNIMIFSKVSINSEPDLPHKIWNPRKYPKVFLKKYKESINTFLSVVLPKGYDFTFKGQSSITTYQQLYFLIDGGFAKETKASKRFQSLMRVHGSLQLYYLIEQSLVEGDNYSDVKLNDQTLSAVADCLLVNEFSHESYKKVMPLFLQFLKLVKNNKQDSHGFSEQDLTTLEKGFDKAFKKLVHRIMNRMCPRVKHHFRRVQKYFDLIPFKWIQGKTDQYRDRYVSLQIQIEEQLKEIS